MLEPSPGGASTPEVSIAVSISRLLPPAERGTPISRSATDQALFTVFRSGWTAIAARLDEDRKFWVLPKQLVDMTGWECWCLLHHIQPKSQFIVVIEDDAELPKESNSHSHDPLSLTRCRTLDDFLVQLAAFFDLPTGNAPVVDRRRQHERDDLLSSDP